MSDSGGRRRLARVAAHLSLRAGAALPPLVLMTDDERLPDPLAAAKALPRGSMVVLRARDPARRAALAKSLARVARLRGLILLIAGDAMLARATDGMHLPETRAAEAARWRARYPSILITASAHSLSALMRARHADAIFLSPIFATASHPNAKPLTTIRARMIAAHARVPVYALGGIDARNAQRLTGSPFAGIAAVGALEVPPIVTRG
jgi:thiamine-phosphate pyrophosphorylase